MDASPTLADTQTNCRDDAVDPVSRPAFTAYGSGAPNWLGCPIYIGFFVLAVAFLAPQIIDPYPLHGFNGFLARAMDRNIFPFAAIGAFATWRALTWRLRRRYPNKLLVAADDRGVYVESGDLIPYPSIRKIDLYSRDPKGGSESWIEIADTKGSTWRIDVNMSVDPPGHVLANLRDRALAGGANLAPDWMNGRAPSGGSQLGYKEGQGWCG